MGEGGGGVGNFHIIGTGMLAGKFELGATQAFLTPKRCISHT